MLDLIQRNIGRFMRLGVGPMTNSRFSDEVAHDLHIFFESIQIDDERRSRYLIDGHANFGGHV